MYDRNDRSASETCLPGHAAQSLPAARHRGGPAVVPVAIIDRRRCPNDNDVPGTYDTDAGAVEARSHCTNLT